MTTSAGPQLSPRLLGNWCPSSLSMACRGQVVALSWTLAVPCHIQPCPQAATLLQQSHTVLVWPTWLLFHTQPLTNLQFHPFSKPPAPLQGAVRSKVLPTQKLETIGGCGGSHVPFPLIYYTLISYHRAKHRQSSHLTASESPGSACTCFPTPNISWCWYRKDEDKSTKVM